MMSAQIIVPGSGPRPTAELVAACRAQPEDSPQYVAALAELRQRWVSPAWLAGETADRCGRDRWDLDICAEPETSKGRAFWGPGSDLGEDGLRAAPLAVTAYWCNPPWDAVELWLERLEELLGDRDAIGAFCVPSRTDTDWWHRLGTREREGRATRLEVRGRVHYDIHPLSVGLIKASSPKVLTTVWVLHPAGRSIRTNPAIDARRRSTTLATTRPKKAPHKVGEFFSLTLNALEAVTTAAASEEHPNLRNMREAIDTSDPALLELAQGISQEGLLHPISVFWTGQQWAIAAGFRRALAMQTYADRFGFKRIDCKAVDPSRADLVRLVENINRDDPHTFETCRYLYQLATGTDGRTKRSMTELARPLGLTTRHVRELVRFYRVLPEAVRAAWRADRGGRFTYRRLLALARHADELTARGATAEEVEAALLAEIEEALGLYPGGKTAPEMIRAAVEAGETEDEEAGDAGKDAPERRPRRLGPVRAKKLYQRLAGAEALVREDDSARLALLILGAVAGQHSSAEAEAELERILERLGLGKAA